MKYAIYSLVCSLLSVSMTWSTAFTTYYLLINSERIDLDAIQTNMVLQAGVYFGLLFLVVIFAAYSIYSGPKTLKNWFVILISLTIFLASVTIAGPAFYQVFMS